MYVTVGNKSGHCNHEHETFEEAQTCLMKHQTMCRASNKVSDRVIVEIDSLEQLEEEMEIY